MKYRFLEIIWAAFLSWTDWTRKCTDSLENSACSLARIITYSKHLIQELKIHPCVPYSLFFRAQINQQRDLNKIFFF